RRQPQRARELLGAALDQPLVGPEASNNLGVLDIGAGDGESARARFEAAVAGDPRHHRAIANLGNLDLEAGRVDDAIARYREAIKLNENYATAHNNLAAALKRSGKHGEAVKSLKRSQRLALRTPDAARGATPKARTGGLAGRDPGSRWWVWFILGGAVVAAMKLLR
ncbi:MAG TPA: tetratricopeptide repeat protein, partial [Deinococcales bacterium]|nr:tetratricopeptide repeat protein [Deinococcales bacterium]